MSAELILDGAVKKYRDGREVCLKNSAGREEYNRRIAEMSARQRDLCCLCGLYMSPDDRTFEHFLGRGSGGGHRDDRIWTRGDELAEPMNGVAHGWCNMKKGSKRVTTSSVTPLAP